ncbi:MAG: hypothetical protein K2H20_03310, partial [Bacilli bacterium]|nr:hypothetical protein [Bacilli bacterium]
MPEKISILKESGETLNSNVVSVFMIPDTEKKYIITTENAVDPHGLTVLHVSEVVNGSLQRVATDEEWSTIKTIMRAIISGNVGSYQYLPTIENISASSQYSRDISVSASASKQMIDNYAAGEKNESTGTAEGSGVTDTPDVAVQPTVTQPSSIFPSGSSTVNNEDELIPGIAEVSASSVDSAPVVPEQGVPNVAPVIDSVPTAVVGPTTDMSNSVGSEQPMGGQLQSVLPDQANVSNQNVGFNTQVNVLPTDPQVVPVGNESISSMTASNIQTANDLLGTQQIQPVSVNTNLNSVSAEVQNTDVQVVGPTQIVPTAQIVQEAQSPLTNDIKFDNNAIPSFNPNASLDEVVMGAQEMFMEGV